MVAPVDDGSVDEAGAVVVLMVASVLVPADVGSTSVAPDVEVPGSVVSEVMPVVGEPVVDPGPPVEPEAVVSVPDGLKQAVAQHATTRVSEPQRPRARVRGGAMASPVYSTGRACRSGPASPLAFARGVATVVPMIRRAVILMSGLLACQPRLGPSAAGMSLRSDAFQPGGEIPRVYTCEGEDRSPPLRWTSVPAGAKSLALVIADPDAPDPAHPLRTWVHWIVLDLPAGDGALSEAVPTDRLPVGAREGTNDFERTTYGGPCPPIGRHRYVHTLYALDATFPELRAPTKAELERAIAGHVLAQTELIGTYQKQDAAN